ncbi:8773_t:CDS:1, partial [Ambispora leptoticha]
MPSTNESDDSENEQINVSINLYLVHKKELEEICQFISHLFKNQHIDTEEYLQIDDKESEGEVLLTDEDIVQTVQPSHNLSSKLDSEKISLPLSIMLIQVLNHIQEIMLFLSNLPD